MKTLLWLDDVRDPMTNDWLNFSPIGKDVDVFWVTNYTEFIDHFMCYGIPDGICFDHDLGSYEETGYDCAKWLVDYCMKTNQQLPSFASQSANPVGKKNILTYLNNYKKYG